LLTPNKFEAAPVAGMTAARTSVDALGEAAKRIQAQGPLAGVVKGGVDLPGDQAIDVLYDGNEVTVYTSPKIGQERVSGAGDTLAAAITAELAKGAELKQAVRVAKGVVDAGIAARVPGRTPFATVWQGAYTD
jgi:pyridoxine kinase